MFSGHMSKVNLEKDREDLENWGQKTKGKSDTMTSFYNLDDVQSAMVNSLESHYSNADTDSIDLEQFANQNAKAKASLNSLLFGDADTFHKSINLIPTDSRISEAFGRTLSIIERTATQYALPVCFEAIKTNRSPDGAKFSKALLKKMGSAKTERNDLIHSNLYQIAKELPNLPGQGVTFEVFLQNFYSELSNFRAQIHISTHLADILTASEFSSFSSCYTFDGAYSGSTIVRALDRHSAMVFLTNSNSTTKLARFWAMVSEQGKRFVTFPTYINMSDTVKSKAVRHIQKMLSNNIGMSETWEKDEFNRYEFESEGEFFGGKAYVDEPETAFRHISQDSYAFSVTWPRIKCVACGSHHDGRHLLCDECQDRSSICENCGDRIPHDEEFYDEDDNRTLCESCYDDLFTRCHDCGERIRVGSDEDYTNDYQHYCEDCYCERFTTCEHCDNMCQRDDMTQVNDQDICSDCLRDYFTECDNCGDYFPNEDINEFATGESFCSDCTKEKYADDCEGFFLAQVTAIMREENIYKIEYMSFSRGIGRRHSAKVGDFIVAYDYEKNVRLYEINVVWIPSYSRKEFDGKTALKITLLASEKDIYSDAVYVLDTEGREIRIEPDCIKHHIPAKDYYSTIQHDVASALLFDDCFYNMDHTSFPVNMGIMPCVACPRVGQYVRLYPAAICEAMPRHYVSVLSSMVEKMNGDQFFEVLDILDNYENTLIRLRDGDQDYAYDIRWICSVRD